MLVDVRTRHVLALRVTDERTGDSPMFEPLVTEAAAALDRAEARETAPGKEAEKAKEAKEEAAAIAAEAVRAAREREPEASVSAAAVASAAEGGGGRITCADGAHASRKNVARAESSASSRLSRRTRRPPRPARARATSGAGRCGSGRASARDTSRT